jgi:arabinose-5-phosphate isomerase
MTQDETTSIARRVIQVEAAALTQMAEDLPADFSAVVDAVLATKGRVIVSGVGKSGHIGNKIAATFASTGTPASFVHATEASHGDLGMVTAADFCLLISNSGETAELGDIVAHTRRFGIPMAAISSKPESTLMQAADYRLTLTPAPEACAIGMAPTTSTTLTLALGDALAVALMERRQFQREDFKVFHPGGKLGAQMATVDKLMREPSEMAILPDHASMHDIILRMTETGYGVAILTDETGRVSGVISDGDLRRHAENLFEQNGAAIASPNPVTVSPKDLIEAALNKMEREKVYAILVVQDGKPVGLLRMHDLLRAGVA